MVTSSLLLFLNKTVKRCGGSVNMVTNGKQLHTIELEAKLVVLFVTNVV